MSARLITEIRERMNAAGFSSAAELTKAAGLKGTYVKDILSGKSKNPTGSRLAKVAAALGCSVGDLTGDTVAAISSTGMADIPPPNAKRVDSHPMLPHREEMPRDIPLLGIAVGGNGGEFTLNGEPVDYVRRPGGLMHRKGVFAVSMVGESMVPWRKPREPVYVDPNQRPDIGDHVVIELKAAGAGEPKACYVKRLVRRTERNVVVAQYNPPVEFTYPSSKVHRIYRALEYSELLGFGI